MFIFTPNSNQILELKNLAWIKRQPKKTGTIYSIAWSLKRYFFVDDTRKAVGRSIAWWVVEEKHGKCQFAEKKETSTDFVNKKMKIEKLFNWSDQTWFINSEQIIILINLFNLRKEIALKKLELNLKFDIEIFEHFFVLNVLNFARGNANSLSTHVRKL